MESVEAFRYCKRGGSQLRVDIWRAPTLPKMVNDSSSSIGGMQNNSWREFAFPSFWLYCQVFPIAIKDRMKSIIRTPVTHSIISNPAVVKNVEVRSVKVVEEGHSWG